MQGAHGAFSEFLGYQDADLDFRRRYYLNVDAFIGQRIGLNDKGGRYEGLSDLYLSYVRPGLCWDLTFKGFGHYFLDDGFSDSYGWELDGVLVKKFNEQLTGLLKTGFFFEDDGSGGYEDIKQVSVQLDYKF